MVNLKKFVSAAKRGAKFYEANRKRVGKDILKTKRYADMAADAGLIPKVAATAYGETGKFLEKDKQF